jgi:hypothetical protein
MFEILSHTVPRSRWHCPEPKNEVNWYPSPVRPIRNVCRFLSKRLRQIDPGGGTSHSLPVFGMPPSYFGYGPELEMLPTLDRAWNERMKRNGERFE